MSSAILAQTHNKRAGIFYGPSDGHPIIWNNDWNNLIQKEIQARDTFSRKYASGTLKLEKPVYAGPTAEDEDAKAWRSTYSDLGRWGAKTFRHTVPHTVSKKDVEMPSVPNSAASSGQFSEMAYRHARFQLGKPMTQEYVRRKDRPEDETKGPVPTLNLGATAQPKPKKQPQAEKKDKAAEQQKKAKKFKQDAEDRDEYKRLLAFTLLSTSTDKNAKKAIKDALKKSVSGPKPKEVRKPTPYVTARSKSEAANRADDFADSDSANWRTVYEDLGNWGPKTQQKAREMMKRKEQGQVKDVNRPVYPASPRPAQGGENWKSDYTRLGGWGGQTFRKWIPGRITKEEVEANDGLDIKLDLPKPMFQLTNSIKTSSLIGPKPMFDDD